MRVHKFRAWDKLHKIYYKECDWLSFKSGGIRFMWTDYEQDETMVTDLPTADYILIQWTGLKDKHGVEIYEGDIIREGRINKKMWDNKAICIRECIGIVEYNAPNYDIKRIQKGLARWDKDKEEWEFSESRYDGIYEGWEDCEVIGNKYENPKLLEEK